MAIEIGGQTFAFRNLHRSDSAINFALQHCCHFGRTRQTLTRVSLQAGSTGPPLRTPLLSLKNGPKPGTFTGLLALPPGHEQVF
jgi:hypothetical protein